MPFWDESGPRCSGLTSKCIFLQAYLCFLIKFSLFIFRDKFRDPPLCLVSKETSHVLCKITVESVASHLFSFFKID